MRVEISDRFKLGSVEGSSLYGIVKQNLREYQDTERLF